MGPIILTAIFLLAFTIILITYLWMSEYFQLRDTLGFISGPKTYPFVGLSRQISKVSTQDRFKWFNDLCFSFKSGMVVTWFGVEPMVNIRKPHQIETILKLYSYISKSRTYQIIIPWLGKGVLTSTDEIWLSHRRFLLPVFQLDVLDNYFSVMQEKVQILIAQLHSQIMEDPLLPINILDLTTKYSFDTICKITVDEDTNTLQESTNAFFEALNNFYQIVTYRYFGYWNKWDFIFYRTKDGQKLRNVTRILNAFIQRAIKQKQKQRRKSKTEIQNNFDKSEWKTILDFLLDARHDTENPLTLEELRDEISTIIFTAHNTIATSIAWTLFALGNAPQIQAKIHKEIAEVFGDNDGPLTSKKLSHLKYLDRAIQEALRLYPSVPFIGRCLDNHVVIDNFFIPRKTTVNVQIYQMHHDPEIWENPETFDPDRFLPENSLERHPYAYMPFSAGTRSCIGQNLAVLEIKLVVASILQKWRVSSVVKPFEMKMISDFTLRPHDGNVYLYLTPS